MDMHHIFFFYLLVDGGPEVNGQRSLLGLGDNDVETLKKAVKAQEKLKLRSGLRMMTQKKNQVMMRRRTRMTMTRTWSCFNLRLHWMQGYVP